MLENTTNRKEQALFKRSSSCSALVCCGPRECRPSIAPDFLLNLTLRYLGGLSNSSACLTWPTTTNLSLLLSLPSDLRLPNNVQALCHSSSPSLEIPQSWISCSHYELDQIVTESRLARLFLELINLNRVLKRLSTTFNSLVHWTCFHLFFLWFWK